MSSTDRASLINEFLLSEDTIDTDAARSLISRLDKHLFTLKENLCQVVSPNWYGFVGVFRDSEGIEQEMARLNGAIKSLISKLADPKSGPSAIVKGSEEDLALIARRLQDNEQIVENLRRVTKVKALCDTFDDAMEKSDFPVAANTLLDMEKLREDLSFWQDSHERTCTVDGQEKLVDCSGVTRFAISSIRDRRVLLTGKTEDLFARAFVVSDGQLSAKVRMEPTSDDVALRTPVALKDVVTCLEIIGELTPHVEKLARLLGDDIFSRVIKSGGAAKVTVDTSDKCVVRIQVASGRMDGSASAPAPIATPPMHKKVFHYVLSVVDAFNKRIFEGSLAAMAVLGNTLWPKMAELLVECCLEPLLPDSSQGLAEFTRLASDAEKLESCLSGHGFLAAADGESPIRAGSLPRGDILSSFFRDTHAHFARRKRRRTLTDARATMMTRREETVVVPDEEGASLAESAECLSSFPRTRVSKASHSVVSLANAVMRETVSTVESPQAAEILYQTARDIFLLFFTVTPTCFTRELTSIPSMGYQFCTDCIFLTHVLKNLTDVWAPRINCFSEAVSFADLAAIGDNVAQKYMLDYTSQYSQQVMSALHEGVTVSGAVVGAGGGGVRVQDSTTGGSVRGGGGGNAGDGGLKGCHKPQRTDAVLLAFKRIRHELGVLCGACMEVLPEDYAVRVRGHIVDNVLSEVLSMLTSMEDIEVEEAEVLYDMMLFPLFAFSKGDPPCKIIKTDQASVSEIPARVPHSNVWNKYLQARDILDLSLSDIMTRFRENQLAKFSEDELLNLIGALFQDTSRRADAFREIRKARAQNVPPSQAAANEKNTRAHPKMMIV